MTTLPSKPDLSEAFPIPALSYWHEAAEAALKGASFEKTLYTRTLEGLTLRPLYTASDRAQALNPAQAEVPSDDGRRGLSSHSGWCMAQEIPVSDPADYAAALASEQIQGLTGIHLNLDQLAPTSVADLITALKPLAPGLPLHLQVSQPLAGLIALEGWRSSAQLSWEELQGSFCSDGLAEVIKPGRAVAIDLKTHFDGLAQVVRHLQPSRLALVGIDATPYAEAGAHAAQELAYGVAALTETVQQLAGRGIAPSLSLAGAHLHLGAGVSFFMELAKFRAARVLLQRVASAYGTTASGIQLHARTSQLWLTRYDPYSNFLRQTLAALASILGGAQVLTTGCFNEASGTGDAFARRLARNLQLILKHEVKLDKLIDPLGGSFFLESLTTELASAAWQEFQRIEAAGGLLKALHAGIPQAEVAATAKERLQRVHTRRQLVVGTSAYANPQESLSHEHLEPKLAASTVASAKVLNFPSDPVAALSAATQAFAAGLPWPDLVMALQGPAGQPVTPMASLRLASYFEVLRQQNETHSQSLCLLPLSSLAEARARLDFGRALFEVMGLQPEISNAVASPTDALAALSQAPAPDIVTLCGTDARYADWAIEIARSLKQAHPDLKLGLAGKPGEQATAFREAGIDFFVHLGCDATAVFHQLQS